MAGIAAAVVKVRTVSGFTFDVDVVRDFPQDSVSNYHLLLVMLQGHLLLDSGCFGEGEP